MLALLKSVDSKAGVAKPKISKSVENALKQGGAKGKTLFEKFKSAKFVGKLGAMMGKLQLKAPIHLIDSMITYAIGVVSGMQDMAQVGMFLFTFLFTHTRELGFHSRRFTIQQKHALSFIVRIQETMFAGFFLPANNVIILVRNTPWVLFGCCHRSTFGLHA